MSSFSAETRRATGSTYTPFEIVNSMVRESAGEIDPDYVVDCGCGSGRFSLAAAMMFPRAKVYAVDNSPLACRCAPRTFGATGSRTGSRSLTLRSLISPCREIGVRPYGLAIRRTLGITTKRLCGAYGTPSGPWAAFASIIDKRRFCASGETLFVEQLQTDAGSLSRSAPMARLSVSEPRAKSGINDEGSAPMAKHPGPKLGISDVAEIFVRYPWQNTRSRNQWLSKRSMIWAYNFKGR